jgi:hypothetical protein
LFKPIEFRDASLPVYKLGSRGIELRESAVDGGHVEERARKELGCEKKTSCVCSESDTVINPLQGYD